MQVGHPRRFQNGQSLVLIAIMLPFLVAFMLTTIEISGRLLQRAEVEDALRQATRSAVQTFDYRQFARNTQSLDTATGCLGTTATGSGCAGNRIAELAEDLFVTNLQSSTGLAVSPADVAAKVRWQVLPSGGTCAELSDQATFSTPAVCATLDVPLEGLVGWGQWTPHVEAADMLDRFE